MRNFVSESTLAVSALQRVEESPATVMIEKFFGSGGETPPLPRGMPSSSGEAMNVMDSWVGGETPPLQEKSHRPGRAMAL